jgi:hypothetical protein
LEEIGNQNWEYAHRLFQCVAAASRPLRVEELAEFLAFDFEAEPTPTFREDWREEDAAHAVRSTCSSLLTVVEKKGSRVIQFSHFSVKEYLTSRRLAEAKDTKDTISRFHVSMTSAHTIVAQACLSVLLHIDENITNDGLKNFALAEYAAEHWVGHARFGDVSSRNIQIGMKRLFDPNNPHFSVWRWIYDPERFCVGQRPKCPPQAKRTPLHYAIDCGLNDVVKFLIVERSQDVNTGGKSYDETPLVLASRKGHYEVVRTLLEHGANMETPHIKYRSPLGEASYWGHVEVVRLLLEHHADVNARNGARDYTALYWASSGGQLAVVRMLLEHGADVNAKRTNGRPALAYAQNEEVAQVLIAYGATRKWCWYGCEEVRYAELEVNRFHIGFGLLLVRSHLFPSYRGWRFVYSNGAAKVRWWMTMIMVAALAVWASRGSETPTVVLPSEIADNS